MLSLQTTSLLLSHGRKMNTLLISTLSFLLSFSHFPHISSQNSSPLSCRDPHRVCRAYLYYLLPSNQSLTHVELLFNVQPQDVVQDPNPTSGALFITVNCSCFGSLYFANATYNETEATVPLASILDEDYQGLAWAENDSVLVKAGSHIQISLLCACSDDTWSYLLSYLVQTFDTLSHIAQRFQSSKQSIMAVNNITDENLLYTGQLYFIPINSDIVKPNSSGSLYYAPPAASAVVSSHSKGRVPLGVILAVVAASFVLLLGAILIICVVQRRSSLSCCENIYGCEKVAAGKDLNYGRFSCCKDFILLWNCLKSGTNADPCVRRQGPFSKEVISVFDMEKPVDFTYEEVIAATEHFKASNLLGQGAFGSVYYGVLRDQEVAIKRMKAIKTKEFLAEIKILCKVHHTNLIELVGYASSEDELFLVYEYAEHGSLSDRLHDPVGKGFLPLTWNCRVQIALDTARGLEYIHEHTKTHYVHRDIKSSNILLDGSFGAKVADFGLAKLVEKTTEGEASVTRIVGTFGYLAPEYLRDGQATAKSDVYAFGVVLFELITGQEAIAKNKSGASTPERRSLVSAMVLALKDSPSSLQMSKLLQHADPNLMDTFPRDCLYKVAKLAQQCVEEDPDLRPDMKHVVFILSQILLASIDWEASLAGNSQVFSRLVQGR